MAYVIKRYSNRKLYDTQESRYVTLEEIEEMIRAGREISVVDAASGEDLTSVTLTRIILENERNPERTVGNPDVEPTETESKATLDHFVDVMRQIARECAENPDLVRSAPTQQVVGRLDEVTAARKPILRWT